MNLSKSSHKTEEQNKKVWRRTKRERERDRTCMRRNRPETNRGGGRSSPSHHTPTHRSSLTLQGEVFLGKFPELGNRALPLGITRRGGLTPQVGHFTTCRASSGSAWERGQQEEGGGAGSGGSKQLPARLSQSSSTPSRWTKRHPERSAENTGQEQIREGGTCRRLQRRHRLSAEQQPRGRQGFRGPLPPLPKELLKLQENSAHFALGNTEDGVGVPCDYKRKERMAQVVYWGN